jgi:hypothetical protein
MSVVDACYMQHSQQSDWTYSNAALSLSLVFNHVAVAALCLSIICAQFHSSSLWYGNWSTSSWWHCVCDCSICLLTKRHFDLKTLWAYGGVVPFSLLQALQLLPFCCYLSLEGTIQIFALRFVSYHGYNTIFHCYIVKSSPLLSYWRCCIMRCTELFCHLVS